MSRKLLSNIFFIGLLVAILIPQSRMFIQSNILRLTLRSPKENSNIEQLTMADKNYQFQSADGNIVSLKELNDKPIFINYWATWCPPCIAEMPSIQKLYDDYKDRVHFIIISNENSPKTKNFIDKKGYNFPLYSAIERTPELLESSTIPATFLISKKGEILISERGAQDWNSKKVRDLLDQLIK